MLTQLTLDLVNKRPFSAVPRWTKGPNKGKLNQTLLQVSGDFTKSDPHPVYDELFYFNKKTNGNQKWYTEYLWKNKGLLTPTEINEKRRAAREYNLTKPDSEPSVCEDGVKVGCIDQQAMQVSWQPTNGDAHPKYPNWVYVNKHRHGTQVWSTLEAFKKKKEQSKAYMNSPEGRESSRKSTKKRIENGKRSGVRFSMYDRAHAEYEEGLITLDERNKVYNLTDTQADLNVGLEHKDKWNLDHIIPESHGGLTTVQNLQMVPFSWHGSKGNHNRHVMAHNGSDCDIWYRTPHVMPKTREWTHGLVDVEITTLRFQRPPSCS
tara:strand:- start:54 stop:1013 length:960 start_codon:yes stop_codon:yes gene_type:complete